ncbi:unnamed protein product [Linum tenue]|uniref:Rad60/SUMO-like domain-containing protein n=1 Tax=Linum tenue TaxID=586396 RepID=A0AAV0IIU0_9ROSI|nr:unnamed protein product [Linum tenue]
MNAYCDRQSMDFNAVVFLFDGRKIRPEQTPVEVGDLIISLSLHIFPRYLTNQMNLIEFFFFLFVGEN